MCRCSADVQCSVVPCYGVPGFIRGEGWAMKPNDATTNDKFQENARTDGRMDGRTGGRMDRHYFIGSFWLTLGVQKDFKH